MEGRAECWGGWGLLRISQKNRILGWDVVARAKNKATVRLLKKQRKKKKGETLNQREWHAQPSLWPIGTPHPQKKQGRLKKKKPHFLSKPIDKRLQGEAHFSESFAPSMEAHSGSFSSLTSRGSLLVPSPVLCPPQVSFFYLNKKSKVHFC